MVVGNSLLFPKTFSRLDSLKRGTRDGLKLMIGLIPIFIAAAFLEGFITRYSTMPKALSISILVSSFLFMIWYFIIYPIRVERKFKKAVEA